MGWLYMHRAGMGGHETPKAYLDDQLTYEREACEDAPFRGCRVLKSVFTGSTYYAAVERYGEDRERLYVTAVICLVHWNPKAADGLIFGYKDMDEQSGPVEANCPRSILELLTSSSHPYALDWRNRCYAMLRLKERKVADGDILRLPEPLRFTDGSEHREFRVSKRGSKIELRTPDGFGAYRISRLMERRFEIIRPARRIKTFFPIAQ
ncbi:MULTISPECIES: DUF6927 domain-containing protein [Sphingomonadales]|jgi:hypothetical protein|uniref:DUF6927 domain-containing protein n=1 Tax=Novosphingobium subterraneum TaxID=48936 RepID=A0A0B9AJ54_9SPHN|nr:MULTISPECIES: hypothetical protein [Sphingomonadales]KHS49349.1 hypothetical protein NJ75_00052 [Novosphingobium subterraneum]KHS49571.1 hypothetical protein NJ75_00274 [Novosphingobium subterraneum]